MVRQLVSGLCVSYTLSLTVQPLPVFLPCPLRCATWPCHPSHFTRRRRHVCCACVWTTHLPLSFMNLLPTSPRASCCSECPRQGLSTSDGLAGGLIPPGPVGAGFTESPRSPRLLLFHLIFISNFPGSLSSAFCPDSFFSLVSPLCRSYGTRWHCPAEVPGPWPWSCTHASASSPRGFPARQPLVPHTAGGSFHPLCSRTP